MSLKPFYEKYPMLKQIQYKGILFVKTTFEDLQIIPEFEIREDDVAVFTYPKCGTHWMTEILSWLVIADEEKIATTRNVDRAPYLEKQLSDGINLQYLNCLPFTEQRLYCSHLSVEFAPKQLEEKGKVVVLLRNPKDVAVSLLHFYKNNSVFGPYTGTWDEFLQAFQDGDVVRGSYFEWVKGWWARRHHKNILIVFYESLKKNTRAEVENIAIFLGKSVDEENMKKILEKTSFSYGKKSSFINMTLDKQFQHNYRHNPEGNYMRKGEIGDWKNCFTVSQSEAFDEVINQNLGDTGLVFEYE